ncbi:MAG: class I SAM-dependent methyltransferase [Gemmatimonadaceae bacterium]|nr:class I SAM-dependent methyltransferase [Gemmatimonadaceae bacterium]
MIVYAEQIRGYGPAAPVPVLQWEPEFGALLALYRERSPRRVLEVGTYHGGTLYHWLTNARDGTTVVSLDRYSEGIDNRGMYRGWCPDGVSVVALEGDSHDETVAAQVAAYGPFDWVWIDAGHYYPEVKRDWELYGSMCAPGGIVCFHDILPASVEHPEIEVERLWRELQASGYRTEEIIADPAVSWGGIGIVHV